VHPPPRHSLVDAGDLCFFVAANDALGAARTATSATAAAMLIFESMLFLPPSGAPKIMPITLKFIQGEVSGAMRFCQIAHYFSQAEQMFMWLLTEVHESEATFIF
jgi:hypothetical protein